MTTHTIDEAIEQQEAAEASLLDSSRKPIKIGYYKGVSWAIFANTVKRDDDHEVTVYNTIIEGRYKDKTGTFQSTSSFTENQLAAVEDAAREARQHIREARGRQKSDQ